MWNPLTRLISGDITVPVPTPTGIDWGGIFDGIVNFVLDHPLPVAAAILAILVVRALQRGGVSKGILIGIALTVAYVFIVGGF